METKSLTNAIAATSLLIGLGGASSAQAGPFQVALETLGAAATATDVYTLTCPLGTVGVSGNVTDQIPVAAPLVSLQIFKPLPLALPFAVNTTDPVDGFQFIGGAFGQFPSPTAILNKGSGIYYLMVDKTGPGGENYQMAVHCNGGVFHFTPPPVLIQDQ